MSLPALPQPFDESRQPSHYLPRGYWAGALGAVLVAAAALVWSVVGTVSVKVQGMGQILAAGEALYTISIPVAGRLEQIAVVPGQRVEAGMVIARMDVREIEAEIRSGKLARDQAARALERLGEASERERTHRIAAFEEQVAALEEERRVLGQRSRQLQELLTNRERLFERGVIRRLDVEETRNTYNDAALALARVGTSLAQLRAEHATFLDAQAAKLRAAEDELAAREARLVVLLERLDRDEEVRAPYAGTIVEVFADPGDILGVGQKLAVLAASGDHSVVAAQQGIVVAGGARFGLHEELDDGNADGAELIAFLDPAQGLRVQPGMRAHVIPASIKKEEFGAIRAEVVAINPRPVSYDQVYALIRNAEMARHYTQSGPPIVARLKLVTADTPNGFAWWGGTGPHFPVERGTLSNVEIDVFQQAPITLVLPLLKRWLDS